MMKNPKLILKILLFRITLWRQRGACEARHGKRKNLCAKLHNTLVQETLFLPHFFLSKMIYQ